MPKKLTHTHVSLTPEQLRWIELRGKSRGSSKSDVVREVLDRVMEMMPME